MLSPVDGRARRRAALIAVVIAAALALVWLAASGEHAREPDRAASRPGSAPSELDGGAAPPDGGVPRSPEPGSVPEARRRAAGSYPFANEQPPPDYVGVPDDGGGLPLPEKAPRADVVVLDEAQLAARQRDTVRFLESEMATLERRAAHAEENGDSALASSLRERRARLAARRDALRALVDP